MLRLARKVVSTFCVVASSSLAGCGSQVTRDELIATELGDSCFVDVFERKRG